MSAIFQKEMVEMVTHPLFVNLNLARIHLVQNICLWTLGVLDMKKNKKCLRNIELNNMEASPKSTALWKQVTKKLQLQYQYFQATLQRKKNKVACIELTWQPCP